MFASVSVLKDFCQNIYLWVSADERWITSDRLGKLFSSVLLFGFRRDGWYVLMNDQFNLYYSLIYKNFRIANYVQFN